MLAAMVEAGQADRISRSVDRGHKVRRNVLYLVVDLLSGMEGEVCQDAWRHRQEEGLGGIVDPVHIFRLAIVRRWLPVAARPLLQQHKDALISECYVTQDRRDGAAIAERSC